MTVMAVFIWMLITDIFYLENEASFAYLVLISLKSFHSQFKVNLNFISL